MIHMKFQALFSLKNNNAENRMLSAAKMFSALRVNVPFRIVADDSLKTFFFKKIRFGISRE